LEVVLREELGQWADEKVVQSCSRIQLRLAMLQHPLRSGPTEELLWFVAETDALRRVRDDVSAAQREQLVAETRRWVMRDLRGKHRNSSGISALIERFGESRIEQWSGQAWEAFTLQSLWRVCCEGIAGIPELALPPLLPLRHRDLLLRASGADSDSLVNEVLIRFCGAFLDQGLGQWQLPRRDEGMFRAFCALYRQPAGPPEAWMRGLSRELGRLEDEQIGALESITESLEQLGVDEGEWEAFIAATLLPLRGWSGILRFLEERPDRAVHPVPEGSLVELLAIRLLLERWAVAYTAREALEFTGRLAGLRAELLKWV
jgi:hypothetical protein